MPNSNHQKRARPRPATMRPAPATSHPPCALNHIFHKAPSSPPSRPSTIPSDDRAGHLSSEPTLRHSPTNR